MVPNGAKFIERGGKTRGCPPDSHFSGTWRILPPLLAFLRFSGPDFHPSEQQLTVISWFPSESLPFLLILIDRFCHQNVSSANGIKSMLKRWSPMHVREQKPRNRTIAISLFYLSYFKDFEDWFLPNLSKLNLGYVSKQKWSNESWHQ